MASATEHRPALDDGSALKQHANATRVADDDDSVATEQFPAFDPSHDGSEEDMIAGGGGGGGNEHYTHAMGSATGETAASTIDSDDAEPREGQGNPYANDDDNDHRSTPLFTDDDAVPNIDEHRGSQDGGTDDAATTTATSTSTVTSPSISSPPYWQHGHDYAQAPGHGGHGGGGAHHSRNYSAESFVPGTIILQDNEAGDDYDYDYEDEGDGNNGNGNGNSNNNNDGAADRSSHGRGSEETRTSYGRDRNRACWAKSVEVTDYVVVNGSATNIGAFVVWNIRVETLSGPFMNIRKRYSEFDDFRHQLIQAFPSFEAAVPALPPKSVIAKFRPNFLEKRRAGLQYFLNCILLNPEFSGSPVLKDFLFS
ncbi:hypothetical protein VPNG_09062 [Cytospora leucostoma]|uniref:Endosomal/vacuolar adapter protein YPT35 n=1 Tax=Cytospora leucostoma TaxID=1230097 RepID=A0A423VZD5_9PEZI|nr:hypothetical protein VPNG_09062 [Cytospora leucostoma]